MSDKKPSPVTKKDIKKPEQGCKSDETAEEKEFGGFESAGLKEPTRFGDWEVKGRCSDF